MKYYPKIILLSLLSLSILLSSCKAKISSAEGWYGNKPLPTLEDKLDNHSITEQQDNREELAVLIKSVNNSASVNGYNAETLSVYQELERKFNDNSVKSAPADVLQLYNGYMQSLKACSKYSDIPAVANKMIDYMENTFMTSGVSESKYSKAGLRTIIYYYMNNLDWVFYHITDMDEALSKADLNLSNFLSVLPESYDGYFNEISEFAFCDSLLKKLDFKTLAAKIAELTAQNDKYATYLTDYSIPCEFAFGQTDAAIKHLEDFYFTPYTANPTDAPDFTNVMSVISALAERNAISEENYNKLFTDSKFGVGIRVTTVTDQGQANGFLPLDIITEINDNKIITPYLLKKLMSDSIGNDITVNIIRNYAPQKLIIKNTNGVLGVASLSGAYKKG